MDKFDSDPVHLHDPQVDPSEGSGVHLHPTQEDTRMCLAYRILLTIVLKDDPHNRRDLHNHHRCIKRKYHISRPRKRGVEVACGLR